MDWKSINSKLQTERILKLIILCFGITWVNCSALKWANITIIPNLQYVTQNSYSTPDTDITLQKGFLGVSRSIYYAASAGTSTAVFSKENSVGSTLWVKSYNPFQFYHESFVVTSDETLMLAVEEGVSYVKILKVNAANGNVLNEYLE